MKQQFLTDAVGTLKTYIYKDNQLIVPTAAIITIYKPGSSTELVTAQAMTVAGDGLLSYALTADHNDIVDENYKVVITYTFSSLDNDYFMFYDVVRSLLYITITDDDVINELPTIRDKGFKVLGTAESGSSTTLVDTELTRYEDDYFTGGIAYSTTLNEKRKITNFVGATGTCTTEAFSTAIATDKYVLTRSYTKEILRAFEIIEDLLVRAGKRPHLILDSYDLREIHINYAVAAICKSFASESDTLWWELWKEYKTQAYAMFKTLKLKYDDNDDGVITEAEENKKMNTRSTGRA